MRGEDRDLDFDLGELVAVFGEPTSLSKPELQDYWFSYERVDGATVTLSLSGFERVASVLVRCQDSLAIGPLRMENCIQVRVLEAERKTLEMVSEERSARCFVSLDGEALVDFRVG